MTRSAELYFAYGSNLRSSRMFERVPSAANLGAARLSGHGFRMNKRGRDGSAKANLVISPEEHVWGAVYRIDSAHWPILDRFEGGYTRELVDAELAGSIAAAVTYRSERLVERALAFDWYLGHIRAGAREHALPGEWCAYLDALPAQETDATESASST
ncbi:MAG: gamma-glutamylcyclotransferase family protein [Myxococcota bacterium]